MEDFFNDLLEIFTEKELNTLGIKFLRKQNIISINKDICPSFLLDLVFNTLDEKDYKLGQS